MNIAIMRAFVQVRKVLMEAKSNVGLGFGGYVSSGNKTVEETGEKKR